MSHDHAERLRTRLGALPPPARAAVEEALRARAEHLRAAREARAMAELTPTQARERMAEIAAELRRRVATGQIADPEERRRFHMAATDLERRLTRPDEKSGVPQLTGSAGRRSGGLSWANEC